MAVATLIGDLVHSRVADDRADLHDRFRRALDDVNGELAPTTPLRITVGDEFQGTFASVRDAVRATLRLRLALLPHSDLRHGIGWGGVTVLEEAPRVEDGPGWWAARDAITVVEDASRRPGSRWRRTAFRVAPDLDVTADVDPGVDPDVVEALLVLLDAQVGGLSERSVAVLRGLLHGRSQRDIAEHLGITASAVSQRIRADGLAAILAAERRLGRDPGEEHR